MPNSPPEGSPKGDVYAFAIIAHEIVIRRGVFYLAGLQLTPKVNCTLGVVSVRARVSGMAVAGVQPDPVPYRRMQLCLLDCHHCQKMVETVRNESK
ncbi:hypothetical protein TNCV_2902651 [Trichonephila clavipes]|nr:hypothetical protein TNCV_2902651 [Trichonephila clavipes]